MQLRNKKGARELMLILELRDDIEVVLMIIMRKDDIWRVLDVDVRHGGKELSTCGMKTAKGDGCLKGDTLD